MTPKLVALFGSGETAPAGRKVHEHLFRLLPDPVRVSILDTPAGFEPNVDGVANKIKAFLEHHLQNRHPQVTVVHAHARGTASDPDRATCVDPLLEANYIFAGPGSPTYAARHLKGSLALRHIGERLRQGAILALASAAAVAAGKYVLPVYEIFKAGADLHWQQGLDLFLECGLDLVVVTHWNNREGGADLDTSRCYMGEARFDRLRLLLPPEAVVLGIDEHTACLVDMANGACGVMGIGGVTVLAGGEARHFDTGQQFTIDRLRLSRERSS